jgi:hypothetical protein
MLSSIAAAAPAAAQSYRNDNRFDRQIDQLVDRIHRAEDRDVISRREEDRLLRQARQLSYIEQRYSRNGLTRWEAQDLQRRIQDLRAQFRWERADGRGYGYSR